MAKDLGGVYKTRNYILCGIGYLHRGIMSSWRGMRVHAKDKRPIPAAPQDAVICCIARNEERYIDEWNTEAWDFYSAQ